MKISVIKENKVKFGGIYNNTILKRGLKFASSNGALFVAGASFALSTFVRPIAILSTPKTDKKSKEFACAKSIASSFIGFWIMLGASLPIAKAIKSIDENPAMYLKKETIKALKGKDKSLLASKGYSFVTQLFKLGIGAVMAFPKAVLTSALIPIIIRIFKPERKNKFKRDLSFKGNLKQNFLSEKIGKLLDTKILQNLSDKYKNSNFAMHIMAITDAFSTFIFAQQTLNNKKIEKEHQRTLVNNAVISTSLCILGGYTLDSATKNATNKFIEKFKLVNKDDKNLDKYLEGIKIVKPALIFGGIYYILIPVIATFFSEKIGKDKK